LVDLIHSSDAVLAPLPPNDRNLEQGCCPLKVIEAMAAGTPLIASDMPVVSTLAGNDNEALLVRPGSAKAIKDGLLRLREDPTLGQRLSQKARARVEKQFTWSHATTRLLDSYRGLLS
jgi:glycosyltransferase involved in cell wall biosynthesis